MLLTDLPREILITLPSYLHSFQDLSSVLLTCHVLHSTCSNPTPGQLHHLSTIPGHGLYPQPHIFIALKARKVANWAVEKAHPERRDILHEAVNAGPAALLTLALTIDPLSLQDYLRIIWIKKWVLDPVMRDLDIECGPERREEWRRDAADRGSEYYIRYFERKERGEDRREDEGVDTLLGGGSIDGENISLLSICEDVGLAMVNFWIYCDLFYHSIVPQYLLAYPIKALDKNIRLDWLHYCVPDNNDKFVTPQGEFQQFDLMQFIPALFQKGFGALENEATKSFGCSGQKYRLFREVASHTGLAVFRVLAKTGGGDLPKEIERIKRMIECTDISLEQEVEQIEAEEEGEDDDEDEDEDEDDSYGCTLLYDIRECFRWI